MEDISKFIGIKHGYAGNDFDKCDCFGLVQLFYKEHGWPQKFDDGKPYRKSMSMQGQNSGADCTNICFGILPRSICKISNLAMW